MCTDFYRRSVVDANLICGGCSSTAASWWWSRGLRAVEKVPDSVFPYGNVLKTQGNADERIFEGCAFSDGSWIKPDCNLPGRGGWGFAVYDQARRVKRLAGGASPWFVASSYDNEVWALYKLLELCKGSFEVKIDNEAVVLDFNSRRGQAVSAKNGMAHVWRMIFDDWKVGDGAVTVKWVKGYITNLMVEDGLWTQFDKTGNDAANDAAVAGARQHAFAEDFIQRAKDREAQTREIGKAVGLMTAFVWENGVDHDPAPRRGAHRVRVPRSQLPCRSAEDGGHLWDMDHGRWRCLSCPLVTKARHRHRRSTCPGVMDIDGGETRHLLFTAGKVTFCFRCGAYSERRKRGLAQGCPGQPSNAGAEQRRAALRDGRHPVSGARLGVPRRRAATKANGPAMPGRVGGSTAVAVESTPQTAGGGTPTAVVSPPAVQAGDTADGDMRFFRAMHRAAVDYSAGEPAGRHAETMGSVRVRRR